MKRFPWEDSLDPVRPESTREGAGAAEIHSLVDVVGCLERVEDRVGRERASEELTWRSSRQDPSLLEDFAEFLSSGSEEAGCAEPDRDFQESLRRKLWRLHVAMHVRPGPRH